MFLTYQWSLQILYFIHGRSSQFIFSYSKSYNPGSNALAEIKLSARTIYRSVIYFAAADL